MHTASSLGWRTRLPDCCSLPDAFIRVPQLPGQLSNSFCIGRLEDTYHAFGIRGDVAHEMSNPIQLQTPFIPFLRLLVALNTETAAFKPVFENYFWHRLTPAAPPGSGLVCGATIEITISCPSWAGKGHPHLPGEDQSVTVQSHSTNLCARSRRWIRARVQESANWQASPCALSP